jgi:hypothetical protein
MNFSSPSATNNARFTPWEWAYLILLGLAGAWIVLAATSVYGAGVSSDSVFYLSSADSFAMGAGFFDFKGDPLTDFPPLYSLILGVLKWASGVTPFVWGRFINAASIAALIVSTGLLLIRCFPGRRLWFYLGTLITLLFLPLYTLAANIGSDILYILFSVWFCLAAGYFLETRSALWLAALALLAASCAMLRWIGLAFVVTGAMIILLAYRDQLKKGLLYATLFAMLTSLPLALWLGARNYLLYGTLGRAGVDLGLVDIVANLNLSLYHILKWTSPNPALYCLPLLVLLVLVVIIFNRKADWLRWMRRLFSNPILPVVLLTAVYFVAVHLTGYTGDHLQPFDDRYQAPLYFCILVILFSILDELVFSHLAGRASQLAMLLFILVVGLWGVDRLSALAQFMRISQAQGVVEYNDYNTKKMQRSPVIVYLLNNPPDPGAVLFSNEPEALYFYLRRPVEMSPTDPDSLYPVAEKLTSLYPHWPPQGKAYLVWLKPSEKRHYYPPEALVQLARLEKLYKQWDGEVYLLSPED